MTLEQADSISHSGDCGADVMALSNVPEIRKQLDAIDKKALSEELAEYGTWSSSKLENHEDNIQRILWLAGGFISDDAV